MRLNAFTFVLLAACLSLAGAATAARPPATVKVAECVIKDDGAGGRSAVFRGVMSALPHTARMRMRFRLLEGRADGELEALRAPELAVWHRSKPGVKTFAYDQRVTGLRAGSTYRAQVAFRWVRADGTVLKRLVRRSGPCRQPGTLPNLSVTRLEWAPGPRSATVNYAVDVTNSGGSTAKGARVALAVDGKPVDSTDVTLLGPGETATVRFSGPVCTGEVRAEVDPQGAIRESTESDNSLSRGCIG